MLVAVSLLGGQAVAEANICDGQVNVAFVFCNTYCEIMNCDDDDVQASGKTCDKINYSFVYLTKEKMPCEANGDTTAYPAPVEKTGQVRCTYYDGSSWQWDDECTNDARSPGQDGELRPGTSWPTPRFTDNGNGTVADNLTGLIWLQNANCTDIVATIDKSSGRLNWADALTWVHGLAQGTCDLTDGSSVGDWRVPSINEFYSLMDTGYTNPALSNDAGTGQWTPGDDSAFSNVQASKYWSSSTLAHNADLAWYGDLYWKHINSQSKNPTADQERYVWSVRN